MPANCAVDVEQRLAFFHEPLKLFVIRNARSPEANLFGGAYARQAQSIIERLLARTQG